MLICLRQNTPETDSRSVARVRTRGTWRAVNFSMRLSRPACLVIPVVSHPKEFVINQPAPLIAAYTESSDPLREMKPRRFLRASQFEMRMRYAIRGQNFHPVRLEPSAKAPVAGLTEKLASMPGEANNPFGVLCTSNLADVLGYRPTARTCVVISRRKQEHIEEKRNGSDVGSKNLVRVIYGGVAGPRSDDGASRA